MTISCHSTLQPSLSPFLNQREMYFDNISSVNGFLLLKQYGPIALIETAQNTSIYYYFFKCRTTLGLGSALSRRTKSIFYPFILFVIKTPRWIGNMYYYCFFIRSIIRTQLSSL